MGQSKTGLEIGNGIEGGKPFCALYSMSSMLSALRLPSLHPGAHWATLSLPICFYLSHAQDLAGYLLFCIIFANSQIQIAPFSPTFAPPPPALLHWVCPPLSLSPLNGHDDTPEPSSLTDPPPAIHPRLSTGTWAWVELGVPQLSVL